MVFILFCCCFFFFKQKTAYDMRISDWSSDVCSSDLLIAERARGHVLPYQNAEPVGVVIILRGFDLDMLAEHVEAGLLQEDDVAARGFLGRRGEQAFGPPALVERAVLVKRFVKIGRAHV